ncbi:NUDIX domain-containing protein [Gorillibacterium sp. CAU 1737]|uniref:NUDIX hydrolase n=1 Tax=Gorillibacterium sp. CAU 1737 TaxID=3140362 RepID=UPI00326142BD
MKTFPTHIVAVFGVIENEDHDILLVRSRNRNVWMFPGGQVEIGENLIDALTRETKEESDMEIAVDQLFCVSSNTCTYPGYNGYGVIPTKVVMGFTCRYLNGQFQESDETTESLWVPREKVLDLLVAPDLIDKYKAYLDFSGAVVYLEYRTKPEYDLRQKRFV